MDAETADERNLGILTILDLDQWLPWLEVHVIAGNWVNWSDDTVPLLKFRIAQPE